MFKERFIQLCNIKGESPTFVCRQIGLSNSAFSCWTEKTVPRKATFNRILAYFGVEPEFLLGWEDEPVFYSSEKDGNRRRFRTLSVQKKHVYLLPVVSDAGAVPAKGAEEEISFEEVWPFLCTSQDEAKRLLCFCVPREKTGKDLTEGDRLILECREAYEPDDRVLLEETDGTLTVRKEKEKAPGARVLGKVLQRIRSFT